ncbi:MAG: hypothetical protein RLZ84_772 [Actinomycetota bacterium]|jgi:uncharacterized protein (DUF1015 family)
MPKFEPFRGLRYGTRTSTDVSHLTSPPYDVFDEQTRDSYAANEEHNIVMIDYPVERDGENRYELAAQMLHSWIQESVLVLDDAPSFYIYRMTFIDETGTTRTTVGVLGALEVVDVGSGGVLPHEQTTPKAKTDRLDLTRATRANLSPVWGLSLNQGLTELLADRGTEVARCTDEQGVVHVVERVDESVRLTRIAECVASKPVLIADGHHRYAISRTYRDEVSGTPHATGAGSTLTYVAELVEEQLSIAAIHRLYSAISPDQLQRALGRHFTLSDAGTVDASTLAEMLSRGALCLVRPDGQGHFLTPMMTTFEGVRDLDSARLEHALRDVDHNVSYQHGVNDVMHALHEGRCSAAVLIRPVSIDQIRHVADSGELMPPKSTFFTPKLRTGLVMRPLDT